MDNCQKQNCNDFITNKILNKKIFTVLLILVIYRFGTYISLPGINIVILNSIIKDHAKNGILGMFNAVTGGAFGRMSIFTLSIMPYITASIIMQLMTVLSKEFNEMEKIGRINQYSKYLSVILAFIQGYGVSVGIESINYNSVSLVSDIRTYSRIVVSLTLMGGSMIITWLADQITSKGIGNGSSIIIFTSIISGLMPSIFSLLEMNHANDTSIKYLLLYFFIVIIMIIFAVFVENAQRKIIIQYPKDQIEKKNYLDSLTYLPMKVNISGVMPSIFSSALLMSLLALISFSVQKKYPTLYQFIQNYLSQGKPIYILLYILLIIFFCFFYSAIAFNTKKIASNLKKESAIIIGRRPGKQTKEYLEYILTRINVIGALYISIICAVPEFFTYKFNIIFYLGGTSILIIVNVILDVSLRIQAYLLNNTCVNAIKKNGISRYK